MEWVALIGMVGGLGWWLLKKFRPQAAAEVLEVYKRWRPAWDWVEMLYHAGYIRRSEKFDRFLETAETYLGPLSPELLEEGTTCAAEWARDQDSASEAAARKLADQTQARAAAQIRASLEEAAARAEEIVRRIDDLKKVPVPAATLPRPEPSRE